MCSSDLETTEAASCAVSIHAPAWGATTAFRFHVSNLGFNSRARVGRDQDATAHVDRVADVSIHAPAWGATAVQNIVQPILEFQFTRPRGARRDRPRVPERSPQCFNSRARVGRDLEALLGERAVEVSIHAPAWGATAPRRSRRGTGSRFNSRARVGRDLGLAAVRVRVQVSIHAPAWGATGGAGHALLRGDVSIHAPAWGATAAPPSPGRRFRVSIHAPAWGATSRTRASRSSRRCFNSRARVGRDADRARNPSASPWFQFTRPRGARRAAWRASTR